MLAMSEDHQPIDITTLTEELTRLNHLDSCGGHGYLAEMLDHALPANFPAYVKNVRRAALEQRVAHNIVLLKATSELQTSDKLVRIGEQAQALLDVLSENNTSSIRTTSSIPDIFSVEVPDVDYIAPDLLPRGNVVLVTGNPGCGKSFVALKLAVSIAMGTEFLGRSCERLPVLIVVKEN